MISTLINKVLHSKIERSTFYSSVTSITCPSVLPLAELVFCGFEPLNCDLKDSIIETL